MKNSPLLIVLISVFVFSGCLSSKGIKLNDYYTRHTQQSGDLFFIYEYDDYRGLNNKSDLFFDVTLRQGQETVTINYTFFSEDAESTNTLFFETEETKIYTSPEKLFIDFNNKRWKHRYSAELIYSDFKKLISSPDQPKIGIVLDDSQELIYTSKDRPWQKYRDAIEKILYLFEEN